MYGVFRKFFLLGCQDDWLVRSWVECFLNIDKRRCSVVKGRSYASGSVVGETILIQQYWLMLNGMKFSMCFASILWKHLTIAVAEESESTSIGCSLPTIAVADKCESNGRTVMSSSPYQVLMLPMPSAFQPTSSGVTIFWFRFSAMSFLWLELTTHWPSISDRNFSAIYKFTLDSASTVMNCFLPTFSWVAKPGFQTRPPS